MTDLPEGASAVDAIAPGTMLREWEVVRLRGRGSYGVVFEARRSSWLDEPARALKVFDPIVSSAARHALLAEFSVLTEIHHPHLLAGIDAFDLDAPPYTGCVVFVLELAGEDLATRVARLGRLGADEVAAVGADVAAGLDALHDLERVHGDVKPENILQVGDRWVLGDFGVTGLLEGSYATTPGATIDYRPPELAGAAPGTRLHRSTDIWALGVSLHVAATGRHPFPGPDPMMRYAAVVRGDRSPAPGLDPELAHVVDTACLAPDPQERATAAELRQLLRNPRAPDAAGEPPMQPGADAAPLSPPSEGAGPRHGTLRPILPAAGLAVAVTAVVCQVLAEAAGLMADDLLARRIVYVTLSLAVLAGLSGVAAGRLWHRWPRPVPWASVRPAVTGSTALTWAVTTALLFGLIG